MLLRRFCTRGAGVGAPSGLCILGGERDPRCPGGTRIDPGSESAPSFTIM